MKVQNAGKHVSGFISCDFNQSCEINALCIMGPIELMPSCSVSYLFIYMMNIDQPFFRNIVQVHEQNEVRKYYLNQPLIWGL